MQMIERLARVIRNHGHACEVSSDGKLLATAQEIDRASAVREVTEAVEPTEQAVRDWLGY